MRALTSLNWVLGTLALAGAVIHPMVDRTMGTGAAKALAEANVRAIAGKEMEFYTLQERFVWFAPNPAEMAKGLGKLGLPIDDDRFDYEAYPDNGQLVIRARAKPRLVREGDLPPLVYEYRGTEKGAAKEGWVPLGNRKRGLL